MVDAPRFGSVELIAVEFPAERVPERVKDELRGLVVSGAVTLLDLLVVRRSPGGEVTVVELEDLADEIDVTVAELPGSGLTGIEDVDDIAASLPAGTSALILLFEHTWARGLVDAVRAAGAVLVAAQRIPAEVVNAVADVAAERGEDPGDASDV